MARVSRQGVVLTDLQSLLDVNKLLSLSLSLSLLTPRRFQDFLKQSIAVSSFERSTVMALLQIRSQFFYDVEISRSISRPIELEALTEV
jgi:hypothetical protein